MNKAQIAKKAISWTVGFGAGKIINQIINNNTDPETPIEKISQKAGGYVLGIMIADAAGNYAAKAIQEFIDGWNEHVLGKPVVVESTAEVSEAE